jgi:hypothetical protein
MRAGLVCFLGSPRIRVARRTSPGWDPTHRAMKRLAVDSSRKTFVIDSGSEKLSRSPRTTAGSRPGRPLSATEARPSPLSLRQAPGSLLKNDLLRGAGRTDGCRQARPGPERSDFCAQDWKSSSPRTDPQAVRKKRVRLSILRHVPRAWAFTARRPRIPSSVVRRNHATLADPAIAMPAGGRGAHWVARVGLGEPKRDD